MRRAPRRALDIDREPVHVAGGTGGGSVGRPSWYVDRDRGPRVAAHVRVPGLLCRLVIRQPSGGHLWERPMAPGIRIQ